MATVSTDTANCSIVPAWSNYFAIKPGRRIHLCGEQIFPSGADEQSRSWMQTGLRNKLAQNKEEVRIGSYPPLCHPSSPPRFAHSLISCKKTASVASSAPNESTRSVPSTSLKPALRLGLQPLVVHPHVRFAQRIPSRVSGQDVEQSIREYKCRDMNSLRVSLKSVCKVRRE